MLIGTVPDLKTPVIPILALLITFRDHGAGFGECVLSGDLEARIRLSFRVFNEAARRPNIEVVQSRFRLVLGCEMWLARGMPGAWRTALIVPPSEVVTLARSFRSLAHAEIRRLSAGFLMSIETKATLDHGHVQAENEHTLAVEDDVYFHEVRRV